MTPRATVLIATHNHGRLLTLAARSALTQTVRELEVFIVGDGATEETRAAALALAKEDSRVRFFDNPKGPHHGERHRHAALLHARGRVVCYLSDDDLWLPDHVETMERQLAEADLTHALCVRLYPGRPVVVRAIDLRFPFFRKSPHIAHTFAAHTLAAYRRLPEGWREPPPHVYVDTHMWRQFFMDPACRVVSGMKMSALHFGSAPRRGWSLERRLEEQASWAARIATTGWREPFEREMLESSVLERAQFEAELFPRLRKAAAFLNRCFPETSFGDRLFRLPERVHAPATKTAMARLLAAIRRGKAP